MARVIIRQIPPSVAVKFERAPSRLAMTITRGDGSRKRLGPGEAGGNIPQGIVLTTKDPSGFAEMSSKLGRDVFRDHDDLNLFDDVKVYGPGVASAWEGRMLRFPRESHSRSILPSSVGYAAHLRDDPSVAEVYVERRLDKWQEPSATRKIGLIGASLIPDGSTGVVRNDSGDPALQFLAGQDTGPFQLEMFYDAGAARISRVYIKTVSRMVHAPGNPNNHLLLHSDATDYGAGAEISSEFRDVASIDWTPSTARQFAIIEHSYVSTGTDPKSGYFLTGVVLYGNHDLTIRGAMPGGFYGHDILVHLLSNWAPMLNFTTGPGGSIVEDASFVVPHFVVGSRDGSSTVEAALLQLNAFYLHSFGCWEDREFFWRPTTDVPRTWNAMRREGAGLKLEGQQGDDSYNGVMVTFTDPAGIQRTAGPPGSATDYQSAALQDTSPTNPVNAHGIPRRWLELEIQQVTTFDGAIQAGSVALAASLRVNQQGQIEIFRDCEDSNGARWPVWMVRSGDWIKVPDGDQTLRRIIQTTYDNDQKRVTCDLDVPPMRLSALLERWGASAVGVIS